MMIVLSYFHHEKGNLLFSTFPEGISDNQLSVRLGNLLDTANEEFEKSIWK